MEVPKTRQDLALLIEGHLSNPSNDTELTKGCLLAHFRAKSNQEFREFLKGFYGERWSDSLSVPVRTATHRIDKLVKDKANNIRKPNIFESVERLLNEKYMLPVSRKRPLSEIENSDPSAPETPPATPVEPPTSSAFDYIAPKRSCLDCLDLRQESSGLRKELNSIRTEAEKLQKRVDVKFKKEPRVLGQTIKRLRAQLDEKEQDFSELQVDFLELQEEFLELDTKYNEKVTRVEHLVEEVEHLNEQITKVNKQKAEIQRYHSAEKRNSVLSSQLKKACEEIKSLKSQVAYTENQLLEHDKENIVDTIDGNQFDSKTRKCILFCLEKNVAQHHASSIVEFIVREMTGKTVTKLPKRSTIQNIARESSIVSNIQTGHIMSESTNVTMAWDATTISGTHMNEVHVMTPYGPFILDVSEVPGARATDYVTNIKEILADISNQYSQCYDKNPAEVKKQIHDGKYKYIFLKSEM